MGDYYRERRDYRDRRESGSSSGDEVRTTVRRYKVKTPSRVDRVTEDDRRSSHFSSRGGRNSSDYLEIDRFNERSYPDRTRSAADDRGGRITVWEDKDSDRRSTFRGRDDDVRVEKKYEETFEDRHGHEVDRYRKETEYFVQQDPQPAPLVIRQRAPEPQKIYVQGAPAPAPIIIPRQEVVLRQRDEDRRMARRRDSYDEDYYYRHEKRDGPYRDTEVTRWDRRRRGSGNYSDDDDYYVRKKTVVRRDRSESSDHHKRKIAEGALAGAGITALLSSRRDAGGDLPANRGRKVLAGAALGALGTEAVRRAHSAYGDRRGRDESPGHHSRLKKGLELAAVALAAAGAAKYMQTNKIEKEESRRGRSRPRGGRSASRSYSKGSRGSYSRSPSRSKSRRRSISKVAKAALGTAAVAGIAKHFHDKRSKSRGRSRSHSALRTVAGVGGAAAVAGLAHKAWKSHKEKEKDNERGQSRSRGVSRDSAGSDYYRRGSRSPSKTRSLHSEGGPDPELGLVEYGNDPLSPDTYPDDRAYDAEAEARRRRRERRRDRDRSNSGSESEEKRSKSRSRSRSRLRDMAAAGAAAIGIKEYKSKKDAEKRERKSRESRKEEEKRRRESESRGRYDNQDHPPSPPHASGGAYYPPYPQSPGNSGPGYPQHNGDQSYIPQDYMGYVPPPPPPDNSQGYPMSGANGNGNFGDQGPPPPAGPPGPPGPPPNHVSDTRFQSQEQELEDVTSDQARADASKASKNGRRRSVAFGPLSPKSSRTMMIHKSDQSRDEEESEGSPPQPDADLRHRRGSDPTSTRSPGLDFDSDSSSAPDVENLPDRFDRHGRPLDPKDRRGQRIVGMTTRSGQFERRPQQAGDWQVKGAWHVSNSDHGTADELANDFTAALEGKGSWLSVLGNVLGGGLTGGNENEIRDGEDGNEDNRQDDRQDEKRRRMRGKKTRAS